MANVSLVSALGDLQGAREVPPEVAEPHKVTEAASKPVRKQGEAKSAVQPIRAPKPPAADEKPKGVGKSANPEFAAVKVLLRKDTRRDAERLWADTTGQDFSELVEHLCAEFLSKNRRK